MPTKLNRLSLREQRFILAYLGQANGNGTKAAILAGYARKGADVRAVELLGRRSVQQAIAAKVEKLEAKGIATAAEIDAVLTEALRDTKATWGDRVAAAKELNKVTGRHITRVEGNLDVVHHTPESLMRLSDAELADLMEREGKAALALAAEFRANHNALPAKAERA